MAPTRNNVVAAHHEPNVLFETPGINMFAVDEDGQVDKSRIEWFDYAGTYEQWSEQGPTRAAEEMLAERGYRVTSEWTDLGGGFVATVETR